MFASLLILTGFCSFSSSMHCAGTFSHAQIRRKLHDSVLHVHEPGEADADACHLLPAVSGLIDKLSHIGDDVLQDDLWTAVRSRRPFKGVQQISLLVTDAEFNSRAAYIDTCINLICHSLITPNDMYTSV